MDVILPKIFTRFSISEFDFNGASGVGPQQVASVCSQVDSVNILKTATPKET